MSICFNRLCACNRCTKKKKTRAHKLHNIVYKISVENIKNHHKTGIIVCRRTSNNANKMAEGSKKKPSQEFICKVEAGRNSHVWPIQQKKNNNNKNQIRLNARHRLCAVTYDASWPIRATRAH